VTVEFRAGAGRAAVRFDADAWPTDGFTDEHDPLMVRVLVLDGARRIVLAVLDQTALPPGPLEAVRRVLVETTGTTDVLVSVSHTFSAPHLTLPDDAGDDRARAASTLESVLAATRAAADTALGSLRAAAVGTASGRCAIAVNRDLETVDGWTLGVDESGFTDPTLVVTGIYERDGSPLAILVNAAVQPSVMHGSVATDGARRVSADLAGTTTAALESALPGVVAFFLIGAAGDQSPLLTAVRANGADAGAAGFIVAELLGERLAQAVLRTFSSIENRESAPALDLIGAVARLPGQVPTERQDICPTRSPRYAPAEEREAPFWILRIAEASFVGVQVELSATTGADIRSSSPFEQTAVMTLVNGGAKYLPDVRAFDRGTYEAQSSRYARGGAEALAEAITRQLLEAKAVGA
jgi:hypothetical protein